MAKHKYLYRAVATYDEAGARIHFQRFIVIGETPCFYRVVPESLGYLIEADKGAPEGGHTRKLLKKNTRLVGKASERPYCHESIERAIRALYRRRRRQLLMAEIESGLSRAVIAKIQPMLGDDRLMPSGPMDIGCGMFPEMELVRFD